jgi:tRNA dimethylallyltransferase
MKLPLPIFIAGPTASGKSAVALELAERVRGEIISVDSMQVYRGLEIGTAKPSATDQARVPHHLIDVADLTESFDAAQFVKLARLSCDAIQARGKTPLFCGGTGFYFKAYLEGLGESPRADPDLRFQLEQSPFEELKRELEERDPETYRRIDLQNRRRVIRALEVIRLTGKPFSKQKAGWKKGPAGPPLFFGLERDREDLRRRIDQRVDEMFERGLVKETERLLERGLEKNRTALQAIGYRQVVEWARGMRGLSETRALVKQRTRQFAKRQMTWFRNQLEIQWLPIRPGEGPQCTADFLAEKHAKAMRESGQTP